MRQSTRVKPMLSLLCGHGFVERASFGLGRRFVQDGHTIDVYRDGGFHVQFSNGGFGQCRTYRHSIPALASVLGQIQRGERG